MSLYREHGIVLRTWRLGEADRIVSLLTEQHGKVRAVAKGARKARSRFAARLQPGRHLALQLFAGRGELDTVTQAETVDGFTAIASDLPRLGRAAVMLEAAELATLDREPDAELYRLLLGALRALEAADRPVVLTGFLLKLLAHEGVQPALDRCVSCGSEDDLVAYDVGSGGVRCRGCRAGVPLAEGCLGIMRAVLAGRLRAVLDTPPSPATEAAERVALAATERFLERRLRAPGVAHEAVPAPAGVARQLAREMGPQAPLA